MLKQRFISALILSIGIVSVLFLLPSNYLIIFILLLTCVSLLEFLALRFATLTAILFVCFSLILFYLSLVWQLIKFDKNNPQLCLKIFKFNNISGFTLFLTIIFINL